MPFGSGHTANKPPLSKLEKGTGKSEQKKSPWDENTQLRDMPTFLHRVLNQQVFLAQDTEGIDFGSEYRCIPSYQFLSYSAFCDDFGPMNMASIVDFIRMLDHELSSEGDKRIVLCVENGRRPLTNAVFLLGAYMIIKHDITPQAVSDHFKWIESTLLEPYRDATYSRPDFELLLIDCWRGLAKGKAYGWVKYGATGFRWGQIDVDEYLHYDSPANGHLHEVVPGKFVAFQGPVDLGGAEYADLPGGARLFSPAFYGGVLKEMGVELVVRLNEARYDAAGFAAHGVRHLHLEFDDCTSPPDPVAAAFLRAADGARGAVAVHCRAGLGRTGTLIALWLMRARGFTAREAMGWLRIMRPGSVIGEQQHYLVRAEAGPNGKRRLPERRPAAAGAAPLKASAPPPAAPAPALAAPACAGGRS